MDPHLSPEPVPVVAATFVPPPKVPWYSWRRIGFNFLTLSIAFHVLLGIGAAYFVVQITYEKKKSFAGGAPAQSAPQHAQEHKVSMAKAQQRSSAPVAMTRVVTTGASKVALPSMPTTPMEGAMVPVSMSGMGSQGLGGLGAMGGGSKAGGNAPSFFGLRTSTAASALVGAFYDLKQTKDAQPSSDMNVSLDVATPGQQSPAHVAYGKFVGQFIKGGMSEGLLGRYFRGPSALYTKQFFIPKMSANNGPKAFNVEAQVQPKRWLAVYHGQIIPPESGRYRFVGLTDDVMAVRFNNTVALDGSLANYSGLQSKQTLSAYKGLKGSLHVGAIMNVSAGSTYPVEVVIGEDPGGVFYSFLLVEKIGEAYEKNADGTPILPVFKVGAIPTPVVEAPKGREEDFVPQVAPDTTWSVWKAAPPTSSL